ncbi:MAG: nitroreductase family protein [Dethiobacteria bacterium]
MLSCSEAIIRRRSIRKFQDRPIPEEYLDQIIEAARLAPSGTNRQPWRFVLLQGDDKEKIAGSVIQPFVLKAPAVFVCCLDKHAYLKTLVEERLNELVQADVVSKEAAGVIYQHKLPEKVEDVVLPASAYLDLGIAIENMVLMATSYGLGTCWVRLFNPAQVQETLALPACIEAVVLLPVGYPDQDPLQRPRLSRMEIMIQP